ncbi:MAG: helix-turn-helix domain-containing protein [Zoogloeaceae bacterium]|nr:helix-turn-helix domain-containing protein [Zoogloeaceae bacterium]
MLKVRIPIPKEMAESVGRAIARQRVKSGLTQEEVAEWLGVGNEAVSRIERGLVMPNIARLAEFATIFQCNMVELLAETSPFPGDQANRIKQLLEPLEVSDRELILEWVAHWAARLSRPKEALGVR